MKHQKICVLVSGGMDSSVLLYLMAKKFRDVFPIYIRCGLSWEKAELYWLKQFLKKFRSPQIHPLQVLEASLQKLYKNHWSMTRKGVPDTSSKDKEVYLPGRNLLFLSQTSVFCAMSAIKTLALGVLKSNPFPDGQLNFFRCFEKTIQTGLNFPLKILTPFSGKTKKQVLKLGESLPLQYTFSCLNPQGLQPCRNCNKCEERRRISLDVDKN